MRILRRALLSALLAVVLLDAHAAVAARTPTAGEARLIRSSIRHFVRTTSSDVPQVGPIVISRLRVSTVSRNWATARVRVHYLGDASALLQRRKGGHGARAWKVNAIGKPPFDCDKTPQSVRRDLVLDCG